MLQGTIKLLQKRFLTIKTRKKLCKGNRLTIAKFDLNLIAMKRIFNDSK